MRTGKIIIALIIICSGIVRLHAQPLKSDTIDVINYTIHLDLKHLSHMQLFAATEITAAPRMASINSFSLDLRQLTVDSVLLDNVPHSGYTYNDTVLRVTLTTPLTPADTFKLRVVYHGVPLIEPYNWGGFHFLADSTLAFNLGVAFDDYPHNYGRVWFPCLDDFIDRATYDLFIRTKDSHKAVCGGVLIDTFQHGDGTTTWHWKLEKSIPTYLASVAAGNFSVLESEYHGILDTISILIYVRPADSAKAAVSFSNLGIMMDIFESRFGPYRWPRIGFTGTTKGAMEHATNVAMPRNLITGNFNYDWLIAHELSHHWFGNMMTCASAEDMWINEGWARYCEAVYAEGSSGWEAYKSYMMNIRKKVLNFAHTNTSGGDGAWFPLYPVPQSHTYGTTVYDKGSLVAHSLRGYLGDTLFFDAIGALLDHFAFQPVSSYQIRDFLSQHTGVNLTPFFDGWVFTPGFPHFSIDSVKSTPSGNGFDVTVYVKQKMTGRTSYTDNNSVEIGFYEDQTNREIFRLQFSGATGQQSFWLPFEPALVLIDPEDRLSHAVTAKTSVITTTGLHQFADQFFRLRANTLNDSLFLRIEHSWAPPDPLPQPISGLTISPNRYWKISGIIPPGCDLEAQFNYSTGNQYDNALITNNQDSLVILYRANAGETWHGIPFTKSASPVAGIINVENFQPGEYVLAVWDKEHIGIEQNEMDSDNPFISVFPNPASEIINLTTNHDEKLLVRISDISGAKVLQATLRPGQAQYALDISSISSGVYILEVKNSKGNLLKSDKIKIVR